MKLSDLTEVKPNYEKEDFILIYVEDKNKFIVEKGLLKEYLIGTPLLLLNNNNQTMYMSELDNVLDFKEYDEENSYVEFKPEKYNFAFDDFWLPLCKRFHWSWLFYSRRYFMEDFRKLNMSLNVEARKHHVITPHKDDVYNVFTKHNMFNTRLVIIGQDPYPNNDDANGFAFATNNYKKPVSLQHIDKAIKELNGVGIEDNTLSNWIEQGVLLLNSALTLNQDKSADYGQLWQPFIIHIIKSLDSLNTNLVYLLVGKKAQFFKQHIHFKQEIFEVEHPAAASYNNREWEHKNVFKQIQEITNIKF